MGKIKFILIVSFCVVFAVLFGMFLIQNQHDITVDLLIRAEPVQTSVGRFALSFFMAGLGFGVLLCFSISLLQGLELRASRREIRNLSAQVDKLRELSLKDAA
ncbi:MAG TPA: LapA family protein [Dongiaceae bacterium]|jgi:uncharacterized membrane protein YciS (DUF1049 family)|nr:LapA family protein [Dongiaceae bacterium]